MNQIKPKMLVFSHICSPRYVTGAEKLLLFMIRELLPFFSCTLVVPTEGLIAEQARLLGIVVIVQNIPLIVPLYLALPHMSNEMDESMRSPEWKALLLLIHHEGPNVILTNTCVHPLPAIAAKSLGIPVIWTVMEAIRETPHTAMSVAIFERYSDFIIGISETVLLPFRTATLLPKTTLIPPSWDHAQLNADTWPEQRQIRRNQLGISDGHKLVGYISSAIFEAKGLEHFMMMALSVAEQFPQAMFLIVGNPVDNDYFERCLDHARNQQMMDRFRWIRFEEHVETLYPAMDILVVPSVTIEGFGMTALEGMVFGKPVVVYGSGGLSEIGRATGNEAFIAKTGDVDGLFTRVSSLLGDDRKLNDVGTHNGKISISTFGIAVYRDKLRKFVDALRVQQYPSFHLVRGNTPLVYLYEAGELRPFVTERAFLLGGYQFEDVHQVPDELIDGLPHGAPIGEPPVQRMTRRKRRGTQKGTRFRLKKAMKKRSKSHRGGIRRIQPKRSRRRRKTSRKRRGR